MSFCATNRRISADAAYRQFGERRLTLAAFVALDVADDARILGLNLNKHHLDCTSRAWRPLDDLGELGVNWNCGIGRLRSWGGARPVSRSCRPLRDGRPGNGACSNNGATVSLIEHF